MTKRLATARQVAIQRRRSGARMFAALAGGNVLVGLVVLAVGVYYDLAEKVPGMVTVAGLILLGGPPAWIALGLARNPQPAMPELAEASGPDSDPPPRRRTGT